MTDATKPFATLVSEEFPPEFRPLMSNDDDALAERCWINRGFRYDLVEVDTFGDLGGLTVTEKTRVVAFLTRNAEAEGYVEYECRWGVIASAVWDWSDTLRYVTPDGLYYEMLGEDMVPFLSPEAIGLQPFPHWKQEPEKIGWLRDQA